MLGDGRLIKRRVVDGQGSTFILLKLIYYNMKLIFYFEIKDLSIWLLKCVGLGSHRMRILLLGSIVLSK